MTGYYALHAQCPAATMIEVLNDLWKVSARWYGMQNEEVEKREEEKQDSGNCKWSGELAVVFNRSPLCASLIPQSE